MEANGKKGQPTVGSSNNFLINHPQSDDDDYYDWSCNSLSSLSVGNTAISKIVGEKFGGVDISEGVEIDESLYPVHLLDPHPGAAVHPDEYAENTKTEDRSSVSSLTYDLELATSKRERSTLFGKPERSSLFGKRLSQINVASRTQLQLERNEEASQSQGARPTIHSPGRSVFPWYSLQLNQSSQNKDHTTDDNTTPSPQRQDSTSTADFITSQTHIDDLVRLPQPESPPPPIPHMPTLTGCESPVVSTSGQGRKGFIAYVYGRYNDCSRKKRLTIIFLFVLFACIGVVIAATATGGGKKDVPSTNKNEQLVTLEDFPYGQLSLVDALPDDFIDGEAFLRDGTDDANTTTSNAPSSSRPSMKESGKAEDNPTVSPAAPSTQTQASAPPTSSSGQQEVTESPSPQPTTLRPSHQPSPAPTPMPSSRRPTAAPTTPLPTPLPSKRPEQPPQTLTPTRIPSRKPSRRPSKEPTARPSHKPTRRPSKVPTTVKPTRQPTRWPTPNPTMKPTILSKAPTPKPTSDPSKAPTASPSTKAPTSSPTAEPTTSAPSSTPSKAPTAAPSTEAPTSSPTAEPTTSAPSPAPSNAPTAAPSTKAPTSSPTAEPTTAAPSPAPSKAPTAAPSTKAPTSSPTDEPTTAAPSPAPSKAPTTAAPSTKAPTSSPTAAPTTAAPSKAPTSEPSPSPPPTNVPTLPPSKEDITSTPTASPTKEPSSVPLSTSDPTLSSVVTSEPTTPWPSYSPTYN